MSGAFLFWVEKHRFAICWFFAHSLLTVKSKCSFPEGTGFYHGKTSLVLLDVSDSKSRMHPNDLIIIIKFASNVKIYLPHLIIKWKKHSICAAYNHLATEYNRIYYSTTYIGLTTLYNALTTTYKGTAPKTMDFMLIRQLWRSIQR